MSVRSALCRTLDPCRDLEGYISVMLIEFPRLNDICLARQGLRMSVPGLLWKRFLQVKLLYSPVRIYLCTIIPIVPETISSVATIILDTLMIHYVCRGYCARYQGYKRPPLSWFVSICFLVIGLSIPRYSSPHSWIASLLIMAVPWSGYRGICLCNELIETHLFVAV